MNNLFNNVIKLSNWIKAHKSIQEKKYRIFNDKLANKSFDKAINLFKKQIRLLKTNKYKPKLVKIVTIPKSNEKVRKIGLSNYIDKVLQRVISNILIETFDKKLSDCNYAFRKHKHIKTLINNMSKKLINSNIVLKYDIKNFFDEINHDILIEKLRKLNIDTRFIEIIKLFLKVNKTDCGIAQINDCGIIQGTSIANILSNIYMNDFDNYVERLIKKHYHADIKYIRYADDIVIALNDYKVIDELKHSVEQYLVDKLTLNINENKPNIIPLILSQVLSNNK